MNFGQAIEFLKNGKQVARAGWNGKGMFLVYVPGTDITLRAGTPYHEASARRAGLTKATQKINPHIDMYTATGEFQPGWLASQTDMLAEDWDIV